VAERIRKIWLKQSPCKGCANLDTDGPLSYCSIITDMNKFNASFFGKDFEKGIIIASKDKVYRNCPFKDHRPY